MQKSVLFILTGLSAHQKKGSVLAKVLGRYVYSGQQGTNITGTQYARILARFVRGHTKIISINVMGND